MNYQVSQVQSRLLKTKCVPLRIYELLRSIKCKRCNTTENKMETNKIMSTKTVQEFNTTYMTNFDLFTFLGCKEITAQ